MVETLVAAGLSACAKTIGEKMAPKVTGALSGIRGKLSVDLGTAFNEYLTKAWRKHAMVKTLLYGDEPKYIYDFYEHISVEPGASKQGKEQPIDTTSLANFMQGPHFLIISGSGGTGKSMLMRHFFLDALLGDQLYIPIFVELRNLRDKLSLMDVMYQTVSRLGFTAKLDAFKHALEKGRFILLLDGLDEVANNRREDVYREINELCDQYDNNFFIISTRPDDFVKWERFFVLNLMPLNKRQALNLIGRLKYDEEVKERFLQALEEKLFDSPSHRSFAENPLLLTIMLMTFRDYAEVPDKLHLFYDKAFTTLYEKHDGTKGGYKRILKCSLSEDDFRAALAEFCFRSYADQKISFSRQELRDYIKKIKRLAQTPPEYFIDDMRLGVCILVKDGFDSYMFSHRSFQEYFTACFLKEAKDDVQEKAGLGLLKKHSNSVWEDNAFDMLFSMDIERFERNITLPFLKGYVKRIEAHNMHPALAMVRIEEGTLDTVGSKGKFFYVIHDSYIRCVFILFEKLGYHYFYNMGNVEEIRNRLVKKSKQKDEFYVDSDTMISDPVIHDFITDENSEFSQKYREIKSLLAEIEQRQQEDLDDIDAMFGEE